MDGREVCRHLNAEPYLRQRHTIVLMSALDNIVEGSALNVNATLPKPFQVEDIIQVIDPFMG
jgi:CheY-like chemotaxis protein